MIAALAPLFFGEFAGYRDVLATFDDPRPSLPVRQLLQTAQLDEVFQRFDPLHAGQDRRALASQWSKHYLVQLIPPVVAAALVLGRRLPLAFDAVEVVLDEQGLPQAFKLSGDGELFAEQPSDAFQRFAELIDHLQTFTQILAKEARLSPKVLWSNAGNYLEWFVGEMGKVLPPSLLVHGHELMELERRPDGLRNPLFRPIRYVQVSPHLRPDGLWRQRRVCCIRYRLDSLVHCDNCPLLDQPLPFSGDL